MPLRIRNWEQYQHYNKRRPPWIKLYRELIDDSDFFGLPDKAAKVLIYLWLIASESDGILPDTKKLAFRLRRTEKDVNECLSVLSHWLIQDASAVLADRYHDATPETETETEKEKKGKKNTRASKTLASTLAPASKTLAPASKVLTPDVSPGTNGHGALEPVEAKPVKPKPPHVEFVESFKALYERQTGAPFNFSKHHFVLAEKLLRTHGAEALGLKVEILAVLCLKRGAWFVNGGWSDFTIETLSNHWNRIIPEAHRDEESEIKRRMEVLREQSDRIVRGG